MKLYILGVDIGTSSVKVGLFTERFELLKLVRRTYPTIYMSSGGAVQNPEDWWEGFLDALHEIGVHYPLNKIQAVGLSGFNALVGVKKDGTSCGQAFTYQDRRPSQWEGNAINQDLVDFVYETTWNRYSTAGMWAPLLRWIQNEEPAYWQRADKFISSAGFLLARLTGNFVVDQTRASLTLLYNPRNGLVWDRELCKMFRVDEGKLPQICESWNIVGKVTQKAAAITGLASGIPVVAGAIDSMCAALGSGITNEPAILDIGGSAGGLIAVGESPRPDPRFWTVQYALPNLWASIGPMNTEGSGWKWFVDNFGGGRSDEELLKLAEAVNPGADGLTFVPFLMGSRAPYWRMDIQAGFHGVTAAHGTAHFARAVMEGSVYCLRDIFLALRDLGYSAEEIWSVGGSVKHTMWLQMKADVLGVPYRLGSSEAACIGAAILAALGTGVLSVDSIEGALIEHVSDRRILPRATQHAAYMAAYQLYRRRCEYHIFEAEVIKS